MYSHEDVPLSLAPELGCAVGVGLNDYLGAMLLHRHCLGKMGLNRCDCWKCEIALDESNLREHLQESWALRGWRKLVLATTDKKPTVKIGCEPVWLKCLTKVVPEQPDTLFHIYSLAVGDGLFSRVEQEQGHVIGIDCEDHRA